MQRRRGLNYALITATAAVMRLLLLRAPFRSGSLAADFLSNRYVFTYLLAAIAGTTTRDWSAGVVVVYSMS